MKRKPAPVEEDTIPKLTMIQKRCQGFTGLPPHRDPDLRLAMMEDLMAARLGLRERSRA